MENILELHNVTKTYKKQTVLNDVSMTICKGDIYGLIGRNGSGKTTLLKSIVKMIHLTSGEIQLFGATTNKEFLKQLRRVGNVIETPIAYDQLTAAENLTYYCKVNGIIEKDAVDKALAFVDLQDTGKKKYKHFSLGMKQKLGLAIALLNKPDFLILDEPINGLDPVAIAEFRELLLKLNREQNMTILISSHILDELFQVATRFGFIKDGIMIKEMTKEEFELEAQMFIHLEVDTINDTVRALEEMGITNYKVVNNKQINIYDMEVSIRTIVRQLTQMTIAIDRISLEGDSLESYFKNLIID